MQGTLPHVGCRAERRVTEVPAGELSRSVDIPETDLEITTMRSGGAGDLPSQKLCATVPPRATMQLHCFKLATAMLMRLLSSKHCPAYIALLTIHP